jgi:tetratricopeptide (TPR) repeat protein
LKAAIALVDGNVGAGASTKAYFHNRLGETLWRAGFDEEALKSFHRAGEICPSDYKTLANLTRVAAHKKAWSDVVDLGEKTASTAHMTDIDGLVALAFQKLGRKEEAKAKIAEIDAMNRLEDHLHGHSHGQGHEHGHTHDRLYAVLLADQGRHLDVAVRLASEDLKKRPDIYAWDTYAWALFKSGKKVEAKVAMRKALVLGTKDRRLAEHAKAIGVEAPAIYAAELARCTPEFKTAK